MRFIAPKHTNPRKLRDSRSVSLPRSAQNPAKYVIHALWGGRDRFYVVYLRFVNFKVQPYRTLGGLGSLLPRLFAVREIPGAPLSHFGGVGITSTSSF